MKRQPKINIIGGGLAGSECALFLAKNGIKVSLIEQKPNFLTPAHSMPNRYAELVCSNSLKGEGLSTASGVLKAELELLGCSLLEIAKRPDVRVPAGGALAVDRDRFAEEVTKAVEAESDIEKVSICARDIDRENAINVVATGPLTDGALFERLFELVGEPLHFYDAAAPIVTGESIDYERAFGGSRYGRGGESDYVNCPMNREEYEVFTTELIGAETVVLKNFEKSEIFEGCMPVEVMAKRGFDSLRFGTFRPVGLYDADGKRPYAVVQLRRENNYSSLYNLVGCQTNLTFSEQKRVFSLIPALRNAEYVKYGVMHRNSYINAPKVLDCYYRLKSAPDVFIAGQLSGVEGYVESVMGGLMCGINVLRTLEGKELFLPPCETVIGSITRYITTADEKNFQPMNANFGILPSLADAPRAKSDKKLAYAERAVSKMKEYMKEVNYNGI